MSQTAYVNGHFVPMQSAMVHIEDRGFQFADGVYEVVACFNGRFLDMQPHLERLERSCAAIEIALPCGIEQLTELVQETWQKNPFSDAMIYIQVTRGVAPRAHLAPDNLEPTLIITSAELPRPSEAKLSDGACAITLADFRWKHCEIKSIALLASVMGKQQAHRQHADEAFWLDAEGHVLEGCSTNIFAIINEILVTHPLDHQVLGGITRNMLIRIAREAGIAIEERPWRLDEAGLSETMLTSTTNAVLPVCSMDGKPVSSGRPGPMSIRLRGLMLDAMDALRQS
ncbi:MAG: aminotransferase class IV [Mariprofundaceae bacterium]|nr:aminotransferase class IV [Mariprofundaceae bacterium]